MTHTINQILIEITEFINQIFNIPLFQEERRSRLPKYASRAAAASSAAAAADGPASVPSSASVAGAPLGPFVPGQVS